VFEREAGVQEECTADGNSGRKDSLCAGLYECSHCRYVSDRTEAKNLRGEPQLRLDGRAYILSFGWTTKGFVPSGIEPLGKILKVLQFACPEVAYHQKLFDFVDRQIPHDRNR